MKYRKVIIDEAIGKTIIGHCEEIAEKFEIVFYEIGCDGDHIHFFLQVGPKFSASSMITKIKSLLNQALFEKHLHPKTTLVMTVFVGLILCFNYKRPTKIFSETRNIKNTKYYIPHKINYNYHCENNMKICI